MEVEQARTGQPGMDRPVSRTTVRLRQRMRLILEVRTVADVSAMDRPNAESRPNDDGKRGRRTWGIAGKSEHRARPAKVMAAHG